MNKINLKLKATIYSLALMALMTSNAKAGGYSTSLYSTSGLGNAYSGSTTGSHDVSDIFFNPAVTAGKDKSEIVASFSYLRLAIDPDNMSSNFKHPVFGTLKRDGAESRNVGTQKLIPALYFSSPINDKTAFNLAITSPFGLETKYNKNWSGRFRALNSSIATLNINPSVAYKITDDLSFGAGVMAQYYKANLTKEVFTSQTTTGLATGAALGLAGALGFLAGAVVTAGTGSGAISVAWGNGQLVLDASTLYGAVGGKVSGCFGLAKKPFKNRNIMFSCTVIY